MSAPIVMWRFNSCWGMPSGSPFCVKLETWLRMAELPYEARDLSGPPRSASGKLPYIERTDGTVLSDSQRIQETLAQEHEVALDAWWGPEERAMALLLRRLFEEHLYWAAVHERWLVDANWPDVSKAYFGALPFPLRYIVPVVARRSVRSAAHGQGISRYDDAARARLVADDLDAISQILGERDFLLGQPSSVDAVGFAFLGAALCMPFENPVTAAVRERPSLVAYAERCRDRWWPELPALA